LEAGSSDPAIVASGEWSAVLVVNALLAEPEASAYIRARDLIDVLSVRGGVFGSRDRRGDQVSAVSQVSHCLIRDA
jgi:hypothetical protein